MVTRAGVSEREVYVHYAATATAGASAHGDQLARARAQARARALPIRPTHRTTLVLRAIESAPSSSNREVADAAGLSDEGQTSKLLARLERHGLIENVGVGAARGEPNAWLLTPEGRRVVELLDEALAARAPRRIRSARCGQRLFGAASRSVRRRRREGRRTTGAPAAARQVVVRLWLQVTGCAESPESDSQAGRFITERKRSSGTVRHVRMLGLCLAAMLALGALTAGQALAKKEKCIHYGPVCETPKEHAEFQGFANCPVEFTGYGEGWYPGDVCVDGESFYKETWESKEQKANWEKSTERTAPGYVSHFTTGKVTVNLKNPIILRGALDAIDESNGEGTTEANWVPAIGAATIEPVAQPTIPLNKGVNASLLSGSELERYNYYVKVAHETKTTATVELAGPVKDLLVDVENQLIERGPAFTFPVKVKLSNPFLGESCYVGSEASPIDVPFTTGEAGELRGKTGTLVFGKGGTITLWGDTLVSDNFTSPGVEGCGVGGGADEAIDSALGLPSASGNTSVINGVLKLNEPSNVIAGLKGEL